MWRVLKHQASNSKAIKLSSAQYDECVAPMTPLKIRILEVGAPNIEDQLRQVTLEPVTLTCQGEYNEQ